MTVYYVLYLLIGWAYVSVYGTPMREEKRRKLLCGGSFLLVFLLFSLRHPSMGVDLGYGNSYGYLANFLRIANMSWSRALFANVVNYERGYILFNKLISLISNNQQVLLVCSAFVSIFPVFYVIYKESKYPLVSVFVFMGLPSFMILFSGIRQAIAVGICFYALPLIRNRQSIRFCLVVCLAMLFHKTAWVFLLAYPAYHIPMKNTWRMLSLASLPVLFICRNPIFNIFKVLFKENAVADHNGASTLFVVFAMIYLFTILFSGEEEELRGMKNIFFLACCIQAVGGTYSTVMRVGYYFMTVLILLLPLVLFRMNNRSNAAILRRIITFCFAAFGLYSLRNGSWAMSCPYYWFWSW